MELRYDEIDSPIGTILLAASERALCALDFADCRARMLSLLATYHGEVTLRATRDPAGFSTRVRAYFAGELEALDGIAVDSGGSVFQRAVWQALRAVPCGATRSYGEIARALGQPNASRAVGAANARNPVALVVPCHRVVGADGSLTGYAGGLQRKRWLLAHEGVKLDGSKLARSARVVDHDFANRFASTRRTSAVATVS